MERYGNNTVTKPMPPKFTYKTNKREQKDQDASDMSNEFPLNNVRNADLKHQNTFDENRENVRIIK